MTPFQRALNAAKLAILDDHIELLRECKFSTAADNCEEIADTALRAFLPTLPEFGLRIVPVEPTEVQLRKAIDYWCSLHPGKLVPIGEIYGLYAAMIAAAQNVMEE